jgi:hypothetical protein
LACHSQREIADKLGIPVQTVNDRIEEIGEKSEKRQLSDSGFFPDFEQDDSHRRVYDLWNFPKATNEVRHFGNIPPEIIDNLLFVYTEPYATQVVISQLEV